MSRDVEMGEILAKLKGPKPAAFVLAGAAGVGKTRLASEAARSAAGLGFATAQAVASRAAAAIPFGPFAPFLPVMGHAAGGRLAEAEADALTGGQACLAAGDKEGHATFLFLRGLVLVERGQLTQASRSFLDGASVNREIRDPAALRWCLAGIALTAAMSGHTDRALAAAAERDELPVSPMMVYESDLVDRGRAWVSVCIGELSRAGEILAGAAARAAAANLRVAEARVLHDIARLGQPDAVAPRLAALAGLVDGEFVAALAGHAAALAESRAAGLEAAGHAFETIGASLLAAEAYLAAAAAYRSDGLARPASAMARRAGELAASCGDVRTPGAVVRHRQRTTDPARARGGRYGRGGRIEPRDRRQARPVRTDRGQPSSERVQQAGRD